MDRLFVHIQVFAELEVKNDEALAWVKGLPSSCRIEIDNKQGEFIKQLSRDYRHLAHRLKDPRYAQSADPFLVAIGFTRSLYVVTDERSTGDWKLPDLCDKYDVDHGDCFDFMRNEEWEF